MNIWDVLVFIAGLMVGSVGGVILMAIMKAGKDSEDGNAESFDR